MIIKGKIKIMADPEFNDLLKNLIENPESINTQDLSLETLQKLQNAVDPLAALAKEESGPARAVAFSTYNFRESYYQRFAMTTLVAFMFQCIHEWEVPSASLKWTPKEVKAEEPMNVDDNIKALEEALAIAKMSKEAKEESARLRELDVIGEFPNKEAEQENRERLAEAEAKHLAMLYTSTFMTNSIGKDAGQRLHATYEYCARNESVKDELLRFPKPSAPSEIEIPGEVAKGFINDFASFWLGFDMTKNVRLASSKESGKKIREQIDKQNKCCKQTRTSDNENVRLMLEDRRIANVVSAVLTDQQIRGVVKAALETPDVFQDYLEYGQISGGTKSDTGLEADGVTAAVRVIPPQDTFHRLQTYQDVNYDYLRKVSEIIYDETSDLDQSIVFWETFEEESQKAVDDKFDKYCKRHEGELFNEFKCANLGKFVIISSTKANREVINFYSSKTEILEKILTKNAEDKKIGADLMKKRVHVEKAKNIADAGPDDPGLGAYRQTLGKGDLSASGGEKVISRAEMMRLEKAKGNLKAAQELQVAEECEEKIKKLEALENPTKAEIYELKNVKEQYQRALEMLEVPDEAIKVDYFVNNAVEGTFTRGEFYTQADAPEDAGGGGGKSMSVSDLQEQQRKAQFGNH